MTTSAAAVDSETTLAEAAARMAEHRVGALPIIDRDGRACGMLTDRDIVLKCLAGGPDPSLVTAVRCAGGPPVAIGEDERVEHAAEVMANDQVGRLLVHSGDEVVGTVCRVDLAVGMRADEFARVMQRQFTEPEGQLSAFHPDAEPVSVGASVTPCWSHVAALGPESRHPDPATTR